MNTHLSSEEMDLALAGMASVAGATHMESCERCAAEVASMKELLGAVRAQGTEAAAFYRRQAPLREAAPHSARPTARWAMAFAAAVLVAGGAVSPLVLRHHAEAAPVARVTGSAVAADSAADDALLSSVQNDLSTSVPSPLLPLAGTSTSTSTILHK